MGKEVIAFDVGGTNMRAARVDVKTRKILEYSIVATPKTKEKFLKKIYDFIGEFNSSKIKGIGAGFPGFVTKGKIVKAPNISSLNGFNLKKHLEKKYKKKVEIENDVNCFTLAEAKLGKSKQNFIVITLGTGIGGGIVINGKLYGGKNGYAGEFGHMNFRGGTLEEQWKKTKKRIAKEIGTKALVSDLARTRDKKCKAILIEAADYLGFGLASLTTAFDPEAIYIGGGPSESGTYFLELIRKSAKKYTSIKKSPQINWITNKNSGILGASLLVN